MAALTTRGRIRPDRPIESLRAGEEGGGIPDETEGGDAHLFTARFLPPRQYTNPVRGLTPYRAVSLIEAAQYGYKADLQWTYAAIERKEPVLRALKERRQSSIKKLKWTVRVKDSVQEKKDKQTDGVVEQQKEALREVYDGVDNLNEALAFMALATFRGYSHLEKHVDGDGVMVHLEPVPQWYWCFTYPVRDWLFNAQALQTNAGALIDPAAFVIREIEDPLDEIAILIFLRKNLSRKDWDLFVETYGVPSIFGKCTDVNFRAANASKVTDEINKIISNGRGVLPPGWDITSTGTVVGASNHPFQPHLEYQNMELILAGTGGKLTMLSDPTGIGQGASPAHEAVFADIAKAEGEDICECFRKQIDAPELERRGLGKPLVEFALEVMEVEDREKNANLLGAVAAAGYRTSDEQASEMLEMEVHSAIGGGGGPFGQEQPDMFGGDQGEGQDQAQEDTGTLAEDEGEGVAPNKRYYDAPGSQPPAAPFYKAAMLHGGQEKSAELLDKMTRPYAEVSDVRSEANPDPPPMMAKYPVAEEQDQYIARMRKALRSYQKSRRFAKGVAKDLGPVRDKVRKLLAIDNELEMVDKLRELEQQLPSQLSKMVKNSAAARALEAVLTESIEEGVKRP